MGCAIFATRAIHQASYARLPASIGGYERERVAIPASQMLTVARYVMKQRLAAGSAIRWS